jgi:exonuclease III
MKRAKAIYYEGLVLASSNKSKESWKIIKSENGPTGNIDTFITKLDRILSNLFTSKQAFIICGDININYLPDSERKSRLGALLRTYNLIGTVNFPTTVQGN